MFHLKNEKLSEDRIKNQEELGPLCRFHHVLETLFSHQIFVVDPLQGNQILMHLTVQKYDLFHSYFSKSVICNKVFRDVELTDKTEATYSQPP